MDENLHIEKFLKDSLKDYAVTPKLSSFDEIQAKLQQRARRRFFWMFFSGVMLVFGGWFLLSGEKETVKVAQQRAIEKNQISKKLTASKPVASEAVAVLEGKANKNNLKEKTKIPNQDNSNYRSKQPLSPGNQAQSHEPKQLSSAPSSSNEEPLNGSDGNAQQNSAVQLAVDNAGDEKSLGEEIKKDQEKNYTESDPGKNESSGSVVLNEDLVSADNLQPLSLLIPLQEKSELNLNVQLTESVIKPVEKPLRKGPSVVAGIFFNPQYGDFILQDNPNGWDSPQRRKELLDARETEKNWYNYSFGVKAGLVFNSRWQFLFGYGVQRYKYQEALPTIVFASPNFNNPSTNNTVVVFNNFDASSAGTSRDIRYTAYSLEVCRFGSLGKFMKVKVGADVQYLRANYISPGRTQQNSLRSGYFDVDRHFYGVSLKAGLVEDIGSRFQLQVTPNFFYGIGNMLNSAAAVKQNPYSVGVEAMLLFRIRR